MAVVKGRGLWNRTSAPQTAVVMLAHPPPLLWRSYTPAWTCPPAVDHRMEWVEMHAAVGLLLFASAGDCSTERSGVVASGALVVDDYEDTEVGSPLGDPKKLRLGEGQVLLPVQGTACIKFLPSEEDEVRRLSQLQADELADHLLESVCSSADTVGVAQAGGGAQRARRLCSWDCPQGYPDTLAKAAFAQDEDAFGRATGKVVHSCIALWQDFSTVCQRRRLLYGTVWRRGFGCTRSR